MCDSSYKSQAGYCSHRYSFDRTPFSDVGCRCSRGQSPEVRTLALPRAAPVAELVNFESCVLRADRL